MIYLLYLLCLMERILLHMYEVDDNLRVRRRRLGAAARTEGKKHCLFYDSLLSNYAHSVYEKWKINKNKSFFPLLFKQI